MAIIAMPCNFILPKSRQSFFAANSRLMIHCHTFSLWMTASLKEISKGDFITSMTSLHCWHASQNPSSVIVYQSSWCSPISPRYCWWPLICYSWSQDLEHSPSRCYFCNIAVVISSKTEDTLISAVISWHCCVTCAIVDLAVFHFGHYK